MLRHKYVRTFQFTNLLVEVVHGQQLTVSSSHLKTYQISIYKGKISKREHLLLSGRMHILEMESFSILQLRVFEKIG